MVATFLSDLSLVPRHCARLTYFLHPKLREINAVLIAPQRTDLTLGHLRRACSAPAARRKHSYQGQTEGLQGHRRPHIQKTSKWCVRIQDDNGVPRRHHVVVFSVEKKPIPKQAVLMIC